MSNLTVTGNTTLVGSLTVGGAAVFNSTVDLAGGALNTDLVTNFNADLLDSAHKSIDGTLAGNSDSSIPTEKAVKTYADARKAECVALTGDQSVAGVKTFSSIPVLPASDPTTDNQAARKAYVDTAASVVHTTGAQSVAGVKTFSDVVEADGGIDVGPSGILLLQKYILSATSGANPQAIAHGLGDGSKIRAVRFGGLCDQFLTSHKIDNTNISLKWEAAPTPAFPIHLVVDYVP